MFKIKMINIKPILTNQTNFVLYNERYSLIIYVIDSVKLKVKILI